MEYSFRISELITKEIKGELKPDEKQELDLWINESSSNKKIYEEAIDPKFQLDQLDTYSLFDRNKNWDKIEEELFEAKVVPFYSGSFFRYAAAIAFLILFSASFGLYYFKSSQKAEIVSINDSFKPGSQKAILRLSNGEEYNLEGNQELEEIEEGTALIKKEGKSIVYTDLEKIGKSLSQTFNELFIPRGGEYQLELADGTKVWLNSESTLRFPVSFNDSIRQVYLVGEAYFDVSHNGKPFIVNSSNINVRVLGTEFNVSAYPEDLNIKTTLVEGRVRVEQQNSNIKEILSPGQQAIASHTQIEVNEVDTEIYTSWRQGKFEFNNEELDKVMLRLARWYDFEYEFENSTAKDFHFTARIDKQDSISDIIKMLEMTTDVKFKLNENTITIN